MKPPRAQYFDVVGGLARCKEGLSCTRPGATILERSAWSILTKSVPPSAFSFLLNSFHLLACMIFSQVLRPLFSLVSGRMTTPDWPGQLVGVDKVDEERCVWNGNQKDMHVCTSG